MCWHSASLCNLEAEALWEHDFRCKKCAVPSRERLSSGQVPNRAPDEWCDCGSRALDGELCSPPTPTLGLSHRPPVGVTYAPALPGETRAETEWVGAPLAVLRGTEQGHPPGYVEERGSGRHSPDCALPLQITRTSC